MTEAMSRFHPILTSLLTKTSSLTHLRCMTCKAALSSAVKFENHPYDLHRISSPPVTTELTRSDALEIYKNMVSIRRMETVAASLYQQKIIVGFCHLYSGQEACAVGIKSVMKPGDTVITSYRCHAWALMTGEPLEAIMSELVGKVTGSSRGKGGSMHIYNRVFYGGNGIVGAHVPLGTGVALSHKYLNNGCISFVAIGDGAMDNGQVSEAFNFAKLQNLPVIYLVENNKYSMGTSLSRHSANTDYYTRGDVIPGIRLDGMDVLAVREVGKFAVEHIKTGKGPILLELVTYRYYGHSMSDPGTTYRTREEVKEVRDTRDCIKQFTDKILKTELAKEEELKDIDNEVKKRTDMAVDAAMKAKPPGLEEVTYDIYKDYKAKVRMPSWNRYEDHKNTVPLKN
ncbi:pyruvate dehydrogenase E1 component subunit alpha type II, mitochondrial [Leptinotarsa decemlineata]|uniref:pyruvate dehydrogenase E1 component subunit alpha type II, mitochondrial n=1 Tax=Leptinotarsa decemlineata TaxID=7539 RepID=UPI003D30B1D9